MLCHRCPYNGKGDKRCLTCKGPTTNPTSGSGAYSWVHADSLKNPEAVFMHSAYDPNKNKRADRDGITVKLRAEIEDILIPILADLLNMDDKDFMVMKRRAHGMSIPMIAREMKVSKQMVGQRITKMVKMHNIVARALVKMVRKGVGGGRRKGADLVQGDLFGGPGVQA